MRLIHDDPRLNQNGPFRNHQIAEGQ